MSLIEQPRILFTDVVDDDVLADDAVGARDANPEPAPPVDIAREALSDEALEQAREEWAAPPKHR
jgi:hypothetical protein